MTKDEALFGFFKSLRVVFKNAAMYNLDHPAFIRCVEDVKNRLKDVFEFLSPFAVGFTPRSILADGRFWEGDKMYRELGQMFHFRKIKRLDFLPGISSEELMKFSLKLALPLRDFVKLGGAGEILKKENIRFIRVEELDYSQLLQGEGEEIKDVWPYLLQEAVEENNPEKIGELAESFGKVIGRFDAEEILSDESMNKNISKLFSYLKEKEETKYRSCARNLVKAVVTDKNVDLQTRVEGIRGLITDLKEEDMASTLWEEIIADDNFDSLSFSVFSKLLETDRHQRVSVSLKKLFQSENPLNRRPEVEEKIKALLSGTSGMFISEIYRQTLSSILKDIRFEKKIIFDHALLSANYRYILLNILARESDEDRTTAALERILGFWEEISGNCDWEYLGCLQEVLLAKRTALSAVPAMQKLEDAVTECVENAVLAGKSSPYLTQIISGLTKSRFGLDAYLKKIFYDGAVNSSILRAFYRFFKEHLSDFTARLKEKRSDGPFIDRLIESLKAITSPLSLEILKTIYAVTDEPVRIKVLKVMGGLSEIDKNFLFSVLRSREILLRIEALVILTHREATRKRALNHFLRFPSPYGILNKKLRIHIRIVADKGIKEAKDHLVKLSRRRFFWNRSIRREALRVLESWDEA